MVTRAAKDLLRNTIRSTDYHNRLLEEDEMWRQWDLERGLTMMVTDDCLKKRLRMDEYPRPMKQPSRRSGEEFRGDNYWTRKLFEAEHRDPDRWGHSGYKELYPEEFKQARRPRTRSHSSSCSSSSDNRNNNQRAVHKSRKKKAKKSKKRKRHESDNDSESHKHEYHSKQTETKHRHKRRKDESPLPKEKCSRGEEINSHYKTRRESSTESDCRSQTISTTSEKNGEPDNVDQRPNKIITTNHSVANSEEGVCDSEVRVGKEEPKSRSESSCSSHKSDQQSDSESESSQSSESSDDDIELRKQQMERLARFRRHFRSRSIEKEIKEKEERREKEEQQKREMFNSRDEQLLAWSHERERLSWDCERERFIRQRQMSQCIDWQEWPVNPRRRRRRRGRRRRRRRRRKNVTS